MFSYRSREISLSERDLAGRTCSLQCSAVCKWRLVRHTMHQDKPRNPITRMGGIRRRNSSPLHPERNEELSKRGITFVDEYKCPINRPRFKVGEFFYFSKSRTRHSWIGFWFFSSSVHEMNFTSHWQMFSTVVEIQAVGECLPLDAYVGESKRVKGFQNSKIHLSRRD